MHKGIPKRCLNCGDEYTGEYCEKEDCKRRHFAEEDFFKEDDATCSFCGGVTNQGKCVEKCPGSLKKSKEDKKKYN